MLIEYNFTSKDGLEIEGLRTELDRNYADEEQALVFIHNDESDTGGYFELNIRKDETGHFTGGGYMAEYDGEQDSEPSYISDDITLVVTEHGFDEPLREANEKLKPFGKRIVVDYDGDGYWAIASTDMDGGNPDYYAGGMFEHEVTSCIQECLVHVLERVKNPELWQQQDRKAQIRQLWSLLDGTEQVDLMAEFYFGLTASDKDTFFKRTDNPGYGKEKEMGCSGEHHRGS